MLCYVNTGYMLLNVGGGGKGRPQPADPAEPAGAHPAEDGLQLPGYGGHCDASQFKEL